MIYSTDFEHLCSKLNSIEVVKYLRDLGWNNIEHINKNVQIFQKTIRNELFQIRVPMRKSLNDYNVSMLKVAKILSSTECKSLEEVVLELLNPAADIIKVRFDHEDVENGSILFEDAIRLYENAKKIISATAMDIKKPEKYHSGRPLDIVQEFIEKCRFGQTEIGSYVTSVVCPFFVETEEGNLVQQTLFSNSEVMSTSFTRKITTKLIKSLDLVQEAISKGEDLEVLTDLKYVENKSDIISINFLESLSNMNLNKDKTILDFNVKWAPTIKRNIYHKNKISFSNQYFDPLFSTVSNYKNSIKNIHENFYIGRIKSISGEPSLEKREDIEIKIITIDRDDKKKTITALLPVEEHDAASSAFKSGAYIKIKGNYDSNSKKLINCSYTIEE